MFIQTESVSTPAELRFLPGQTVLASGTAAFTDAASAARSPLALRLFEVDGVTGVRLDAESITVCKDDEKEWDLLKPAVLAAIMDHYTSGDPVVRGSDGAAEAVETGDEDPRAADIRELIETRIRPAAAQSGGDVLFREYREGIVFLEVQGAAHSLWEGIESMLRYYIPEIVGIREFHDTEAKPGLGTPEAKAIQRLLEEEINPAVAAHGGHISLVDVRGEIAYIRLEGGCQGCGMANVTLKQGVETEIRRVVPSIEQVLDATDHAGGTNPYYQPGKGGMSPM
jgi:Fe-S cluster biogenesis protein NfuA